MPPTDPGLCSTCGAGRTVHTGRGSAFWLCEHSRRDPRYARYPRLPVLACPAYVMEPERDRVT